jgi:hypothetical protein
MFGVLLWEMFTYCDEPWLGLSGRQVCVEKVLKLSMEIVLYTFKINHDSQRLKAPSICTTSEKKNALF